MAVYISVTGFIATETNSLMTPGSGIVKIRNWLRRTALLGVTLLAVSSVNADTIVGFGDSITQGSPYNLIPQYGKTYGGYIPHLQGMIRRQQPNATVKNWGVTQESSIDGVRRINSILDATRPDWILIMYGTNDLWYGISVQSTVANLRFMINSSRSRGAEPAVANLLPGTAPDYPGYLVPLVYNPQIKALATEMSVYFNDAYSRFQPNWSILNKDGLHPNINGYELLATSWCDTIPICSDDAPSKPGADESLSMSLPWLDILLLD